MNVQFLLGLTLSDGIKLRIFGYFHISAMWLEKKIARFIRSLSIMAILFEMTLAIIAQNVNHLNVKTTTSIKNLISITSHIFKNESEFLRDLGFF